MKNTPDLSEWTKNKCLNWLETWSTTLMPSAYTDSVGVLRSQIRQVHAEAHHLIDSLPSCEQKMGGGE